VIRKLLALFLLIASALTVTVRAQEPTPSSEKCSTAARKWSAEDLNSVSQLELRSRALEMMTCAVAYGGTSGTYGTYDALGFEYFTALYTRMSHFLFKRHPEMGRKYIQEDAAGLR